MVADYDELLIIAAQTDELAHAAIQAAPEDPTVAHAVTLLSQGGAGLRRAVSKAQAKAEKRTARDTRLNTWQADSSRRAEERTYDDVTRLLAERRGITLTEAQAIRDGAAAESRRVAALGSIDKQMGKVKP